MPNTTAPTGLSGRTLAFLSLRLWLGLRALIAGVEKFSARISVQEPLLGADGAPDPSGAIVEIERKVYGFSHYSAVPDSLRTKFAEEPLLPAFLTAPFYAVLGPVLILLGLLLLLGVVSRLSLFAMGVVYTVLTAGLMLIGQDAGVSWLAIHLGLVALALSLADANRFTLTRA
jgi:thiosulfate dehydrogenase [quinone] large subunit